MIVYPLSISEDRLIRWASRVVPVVTAVILMLVGAMSIA